MKWLKLAALSVAVISASLTMARTEPNSFINRLCHSTNELVRHVQADPKVMDRYQRHFAMTEDQVVHYLGGLTLTRTKQDQLYTVYAVPSNGAIRSKILNIRKGTRIWVDGYGNAALLWHCGNPLNRGPQSPETEPVSDAVVKATPNEELAAVPTDAEVAAMDADISFMSEPGMPSIPEVASVPPVTVGTSDIPIISAGVPNFGWLGVIPGLVIITNPPGGGNQNPPVPEPGTMIALGAGAAAVIARRKKKAS